MKQIYAIYDKKDNCCCVGTSKECCEFLKTTIASFYCLVTRTANGKIKGNKFLVYRMFKESKQ